MDSGSAVLLVMGLLAPALTQAQSQEDKAIRDQAQAIAHIGFGQLPLSTKRLKRTF